MKQTIRLVLASVMLLTAPLFAGGFWITLERPGAGSDAVALARLSQI